MILIRDTSLYTGLLSISLYLTIILPVSYGWFTFSLISIFFATSLYRSNIEESKFSSANWFLLSKFMAIYLGALMFLIFRSFSNFSFSGEISLFIIVINMLQGMMLDFVTLRKSLNQKNESNKCTWGKLGHLVNICTGLITIFSIIVDWFTHDVEKLIRYQKETGIFLFPLSFTSVIAHSMWNTCVTYGNHFSFRVRLTFLPVFIITIVAASYYTIPYEWETLGWATVGIRVFSIFMDLSFYLIKISYLFEERQSPLNETFYNESLHFLWSILGVLFSLVTLANK